MSILPDCATWNYDTEPEKSAVYLGSNPFPIYGRCNAKPFMIWTEALDEPAESVTVHVALKTRTALPEPVEKQTGILPSFVYA
jgi:hypothetical protein